MIKIQDKMRNSQKTGFTLIEMLVAIFIFSIVMTIATGAIFSIVSANKTSQSLKSVLDNLNSALDSMSGAIRFGSNYNCVATMINDTASYDTYCDPSGSSEISFLNKQRQPIIYRLQGSKIEVCIATESNCYDLTAPEVHIDDLKFYVSGNRANDNFTQPQVMITISGYAGSAGNKSAFNVETMVTQRNAVCKKVMSDAEICKN